MVRVVVMVNGDGDSDDDGDDDGGGGGGEGSAGGDGGDDDAGVCLYMCMWAHVCCACIWGQRRIVVPPTGCKGSWPAHPVYPPLVALHDTHG